MANQRDERQGFRESSTGEILQSSTTMASIAVAFLAYLLSMKVTPIIPVLIFASGFIALGASILSLIELLREQHRHWYELFLPTTSIGVLFWEMICLGIVLVLIYEPITRLL